MSRKITSKAHKPLDGTEQDFAALTDQWADRIWHLPPDGDHSWRDREAQRIFGEASFNDKEHPPPVGQAGSATREADGRYGPRGVKAVNVLLPISLAICAMLVAVPILVPQILTPSLWGPREPKTLPRLAYGSNYSDEVASRTLPQQTGQAPAKIYRDVVSPRPRPRMAVATRDNAQDGKLAVRVAKAPRPAQRKPAATSLPPIGEAYFASRAAASRKLVAATSRPIGEAYFESHSPATD
jgi:hypothetical protein